MLSVFGVSNTDYLVATATDSDGNTSEASSDAAAGTVAVDIEKSTNGFDADAPTGPNVAAGDDNENGLLDPGETWTYTADGRALAGPNAGTATVRGDPVDGQGEPIADLDDVTDKDDGHYFGVPPQSDDPPPESKLMQAIKMWRADRSPGLTPPQLSTAFAPTVLWCGERVEEKLSWGVTSCCEYGRTLCTTFLQDSTPLGD